jgi:hypothetical protein
MRTTYSTPQISAEASVNAKTLAFFLAPNTEGSVPPRRI